MDNVVSRSVVPRRPDISNINSLLTDIYVRYIAIKSEDFQLYYKVFTEVFGKLHTNMKAVDKYYERYSSNVQFAGSHYDRLRINKPDEFDMDIVIGLPMNMDKDRHNPEESDIVIEQKEPEYVQLRAGHRYPNVLLQNVTDPVNRVAYNWFDERNYILGSKFTDWFKSVVTRALNEFSTKDNRPACYVDGVWYTIGTSSSGPALTLKITAPNHKFKLDVDLVPALKFPEERWLGGSSYREIPQNCRRDYWMVVPKPKSGHTYHDEQRSWRLALQDQERQLLNDTQHLRQVIRLLKKVRDVQGMDRIYSYYIKTLFFWEIVEKENSFWQKNDVATLFEHMLVKLYISLDSGKLPYFWNKNHNLFQNLSEMDLYHYKQKIKDLYNVIKLSKCNVEYSRITYYLLTTREQFEYQQLFY